MSRIESVAEVHKEGVATPAETILDGGVGELGPMEEVCCCNADRVERPSGDVGVFGWWVVGTTSGQIEEGGCIGCGDVLGLGRTIRYGADPQRES